MSTTTMLTTWRRRKSRSDWRWSLGVISHRLDHQVSRVLEHANQGSAVLLLTVTVLNGIAEELFFRGALYAAIPRHPIVWTTVAYTVATLATGNVMLGFAAILLGAVVGLQRRATGGILAPILTHLVWSVTMLYALPAIIIG
jgi:membrane protease YdiL (CAAX protease family)